MKHWYSYARSVLGAIPPEEAHALTILALRLGLVPSEPKIETPQLATEVFGIRFPNPVGLAAGFDKDAKVFNRVMSRTGLGFVEIGTVTPLAQPGNSKPRWFRLSSDEAVINQMGFNSEGVEKVVRRLEAGSRKPLSDGGVVGANIGKNKLSRSAVEDYVFGAQRLGPFVDYLVINVSSPNTPGLRDLQGRDSLTEIVEQVIKTRNDLRLDCHLPVLLKISPDLAEAQWRDVAEVVVEQNIDGLIVSNTTTSRPSGLKSAEAGQAGGLSGRPLFARSTELLSQMYLLTRGKVPLIGVGGIWSAEDAYEKIRAGASLVQLYTGLAYEGPGLVTEIKQGLVRLLLRDGFRCISEAVGAKFRDSLPNGILRRRQEMGSDSSNRAAKQMFGSGNSGWPLVVNEK